MSNDSEMHSSTDEEDLIDVDHYRRLVKQFIDMRRYQTALFWAEKVSVLSQNDPKDIYCQAHCMFLLKEYRRAAHLIRLYDLEKSHMPSFNLLLESLYEAKELNEALVVMENVDLDFLISSINHSQFAEGCEENAKNELLASIYFLKGKIYETMDNRGLAMDFFVQALQKSIYCFEALEAVVQHEMLMAWEEKELMHSLAFSTQATEADAKLIKRLYESKLKKYYESLAPPLTDQTTPISTLRAIKELTERLQTTRTEEAQLYKNVFPKTINILPDQILSPANKLLEDLKNSPLHTSITKASSLAQDSQCSRIEITPLSNMTPATPAQTHNKQTNLTGIPLSQCMQRLEYSADIMASEAERLFYDCEYNKSVKILTQLLKTDPYHNVALTVQIGCLFEMGDYNKLFYLAHKLVDRYPDKAISWYAVGCYYDLIGKSDPARRFLSKATSLDRLYGPAWLAYGHSFAKENEHDQAMAAYFKASQYMRGCHLPLLYIGVECGFTKNLELAEKFFHQAMTVAPLDVFVLHELGLLKYQYEFYECAEEIFLTTAEVVTQRARQNKEEVSARWEPLFNNLAHSYRKTKKYDKALEYHQYSLLLKPQSSTTLTAIGFIHALVGDLEEAIMYFHKSLAINRDCIVTSTILKTCMEDLMEDELVIDEICGRNNLLIPVQTGASTSTTATYSKATPTKPLSPIVECSLIGADSDQATLIKINATKLSYADDDDDDDLQSNVDRNNDSSGMMDMSIDP